MVDSAQVQVFIDDHHKRCVKALQLIALLGDTGSNEYKDRFDPDGPNGIPAGWRVAEAMREVANDVIGYLPIMSRSPYRGFWCQFNDKGQCLDLVEGSRDAPPESEYVWIQEGVEELEIYKRAMESMAAQFVHPKMTALELAKSQLGIK
jgi:hypothetical protein